MYFKVPSTKIKNAKRGGFNSAGERCGVVGQWGTKNDNTSSPSTKKGLLISKKCSDAEGSKNNF